MHQNLSRNSWQNMDKHGISILGKTSAGFLFTRYGSCFFLIFFCVDFLLFSRLKIQLKGERFEEREGNKRNETRGIMVLAKNASNIGNITGIRMLNQKEFTLKGTKSLNK